MTNTPSPKKGDIALVCAHATEGPTTLIPHLHFWMLPDGVDFKRPDGSRGNATWFVACDACFKQAKGDAQKVKYVGDVVWDDDRPMKYVTPEG